MRILLFGTSGQVGRSLQEEAAAHDVIGLSRVEADLSQTGAAARAIETHAPDVIVNAAAHTAVDKAEEEQAAAAQLNFAAPQEMAAAAKKIGAQFIHISTDYVFDGAKTVPYLESDATGPLGVYGATKRDGERAILETCPEAVIIRTSWVFSEFGQNFVKTMLRLAQDKKSLNIVDDQVGGPTAARDIARAVSAIAGKKHRGAPGAGVYHYQGSPSVSWAGFAGKIFEIAGGRRSGKSDPNISISNASATTAIHHTRLRKDRA